MHMAGDMDAVWPAAAGGDAGTRGPSRCRRRPLVPPPSCFLRSAPSRSSGSPGAPALPLPRPPAYGPSSLAPTGSAIARTAPTTDAGRKRAPQSMVQRGGNWLQKGNSEFGCISRKSMDLNRLGSFRFLSVQLAARNAISNLPAASIIHGITALRVQFNQAAISISATAASPSNLKF
ncbi:hypothetical protein GQ55_3G050300 [Panicum hallii var. hallii]|uniref:Uncharacterized protein n=1 Tax=Panicum hallii var. hallii TaxID=1504633 RepID=A0A2T7E5V6_9POAL|nr:hypothetical protein GQ55_3G050300 [Panicum hallii var. hallii]